MKNRKRLFSKALFKQSCKANGAMWLIITFAVCFMLSCVMLISGTSGISTVKEGIEDTIIKESIKAEIKKSSIELYDSTDDAEYIFDKAFAEKINELNTKDYYLAVKKVKDKATNKGTELVKQEVTDKITEDVTKLIEKDVEDGVAELVKDEVAQRMTQKVTDEVTKIVTDETTKALTEEIQNKLVVAIFTQDKGIPAFQADIAQLIGSGIEENTAKQMAFADIAGQALSNGNTGDYELLASDAYSSIIANIGQGMEPTDAIGATILQFTNEISAQVLTEEHKVFVSNKILNENKEAFTNVAKQNVANEDAVNEETKKVLEKYQDKYINKVKNEIVTDAYTKEKTQDVVDFKQDKYTQDAKNKFSKQLDKIEEQATDEITEIIKEKYIKPAYEYAVDQVMAKYPEDTEKERYGAAMVTINPDNQADDQYINNNEEIPEEYINDLTDYIKDDILAWEDNRSSSTLTEYIESKQRNDFRHSRAYNAVSFLIGSQLTDKENKQDILDKLADYDVNEEKYDSMGFDYDFIKQISYESMEEYQNKLSFESNKLSSNVKKDKALYETKVQEIRNELLTDVGGSLLDKLPGDVTDGIKELGTMDLYGLIVGSIFFKMAGLLLPIIYVIMVSNNLIASQVDTGSMAYILSTSTRRKEVTFTQALYLVGSIALMFVLTCITSIACFNIAQVSTKLDIQKIIYLNLGAFAVMFAISGINFFASSYFDRSKRAMALGGGISMFFLVTTILGLFGSPVIPSVVRIAPLNYFNYVSIISLFDVVSILNGEMGWIIKSAILLLIGIIGYIVGSIIFKKKDLPL